MARLSRLVMPNQPHHVIQRGNDRQPIFKDQEDYKNFLCWLHQGAQQYRVLIHAYVLMTNHFHLLVTPADEVGLGRMMQWIGRYYVPYFNRKYQRAGTLWQGRYKATVIEAENYFMLCSTYIELNPVRAGMVIDPANYPWSSYAHHVGIKSDPLVSDHLLYWSLGNTPFDREIAYKALVNQSHTNDQINALRNATEKSWVLGSNAFKEKLVKNTERRLFPAKKGRPRKQKPES